MLAPELGCGYAAARVHHASRRRGGRWPLAARAQQAERMRRIGVLMTTAADDPEVQARITAFYRRWRNWAGPTAATYGSKTAGARRRRHRRYAAELVALAPDVILAAGERSHGGIATGDPHRADRIRAVVDPVGAGFVESLARPGGNVTGFMSVRIRHGRKMAGATQGDRADVTRVAVLRDTSLAPASVSYRAHPAWRRRSGWRCIPSTCATERDRARRRGIRERAEWRSDRNGWSLRRFIAI